MKKSHAIRHSSGDRTFTIINYIIPVSYTHLVGLSAIIVLLGNTLLGIYSSEPEVIQFGIGRISVVCVTYFLCGICLLYTSSLNRSDTPPDEAAKLA